MSRAVSPRRADSGSPGASESRTGSPGSGPGSGACANTRPFGSASSSRTPSSIGIRRATVAASVAGRVERRRGAGLSSRSAPSGSRSVPLKPRNAATAGVGGASSTRADRPWAPAARRAGRARGRRAPRPRRGRARRRPSRAAGRRSAGGRVVEQVGAGRRVEPGERLVEQQHVGLAARWRGRGGRGAPRRPTAPAAGRSARCSAPMRCQRGERALASLRGAGRPTRRARPRRWRAPCGWRAPGPGARRRRGRARSIVPPRGRDQAGERGEQRRLAGAVGSEHGEDVAAAQLEVDVVDDGRAGARGRERRAPRAAARSRRAAEHRFSAWRCWIAVSAAARSRTSRAAGCRARSRCRTRRRTRGRARRWRASASGPRCCRRRGRRRRPRRTRSPAAAMVAARTPMRASRSASAATAVREAPNARAWSSSAARQRLDGGGGERGDDREREHRLGEDHAVRACRAGRARRAARRGTAAARRPVRR